MPRNISYKPIQDFEHESGNIFVTPQLLSGTVDFQHNAFGNYIFAQQIAGEWRDVTSENENIGLRPYYNNSIIEAGGNYVHMNYIGLIQLPDVVLPGSDYIEAASDLPLSESFGTTTATRGHLVLQTYAKNATVALWSRSVTLDGSGSFTSTGAWEYCTASHVGSSYSLEYAGTVAQSLAEKCLIPLGTTTGSLIEVRIGYNSQDGVNPAYLGGWSLFMPKLNTV